MPKLKAVTDEELTKTLDAGHDAQADAADLKRRMDASWSDDNITEPMARGVAALAISRTFAELAAALFSRAALVEQKREIERLHREVAARG